MTSAPEVRVPTEREISGELWDFLDSGQRAARWERFPLLMTLRCIGGPEAPTEHNRLERRDALRTLLREAAQELDEDERYPRAAEVLFQLDPEKPLRQKSTLKKLQGDAAALWKDEHGEPFQYRWFQRKHQTPIRKALAKVIVEREAAVRGENVHVPPHAEVGDADDRFGDEAEKTEAHRELPSSDDFQPAARQRRRPPSRRRRWIAGLLVVAVVLLGTVAVLAIIRPDLPPVPPRPSPESVVVPLGSNVDLEGLEVTPGTVETATVLDRRSTSGLFVLVRVQLVNSRKSPVALARTDFGLKRPDGAVYSPTRRSGFVVALREDLQPQGDRTLLIPFELPTSRVGGSELVMNLPAASGRTRLSTRTALRLRSGHPPVPAGDFAGRTQQGREIKVRVSGRQLRLESLRLSTSEGYCDFTGYSRVRISPSGRFRMHFGHGRGRVSGRFKSSREADGVIVGPLDAGGSLCLRGGGRLGFTLRRER